MKEELVWTYECGGIINCVAISSNGKYILIGSNDNKTYLFDISSNRPFWSYETEGSITAVAISSSGNYLAVGSEDDQVYLFHWKPAVEEEDDDDDLDIEFGESTIPFGNYYLVFMILAIISLIIFYKGKLHNKIKN